MRGKRYRKTGDTQISLASESRLEKEHTAAQHKGNGVCVRDKKKKRFTFQNECKWPSLV